MNAGVRALLIGTCVLAVGGGLGGCGASGDESALPADLAGDYFTTLEPSDIPKDAEPELKPGLWELAIGELEGEEAGPFLTIRHPRESILEVSPVEVSGNVLKLTREACKQETGTAFYDNEYRWELSGSTLALTTVKDHCPDRVAETILTSRPWTKQ